MEVETFDSQNGQTVGIELTVNSNEQSKCTSIKARHEKRKFIVH